MADDPFKSPKYTVQEYGMSIPVSPEFATIWAIRQEAYEELCKWSRMRTEHLSLHTDQLGYKDPQCWFCSSQYKHFHFWLEVEYWIDAYRDSIRPRCAETRDGMVSVIHHVAPCSCHEKCDDGEEW